MGRPRRRSGKKTADPHGPASSQELKPRNLVEVIDRVCKVVPAFKEPLRRVRTRAVFSAPEVMGWVWGDAQIVLTMTTERMQAEGTITKADIKRAQKIWNGR